MKNFSIVYKESIKKLLRSKMVYGSLIVSLMVTGFVLVFIPLVLSQFDISNYYDSTSYIQTGMQGTFAVFGLVAAVVGETNALSSEKIYFLSKPLKRTTFLWAKCLSTLTISLIITLLSCCILFGIAIYEYITWTNNIFDMRRSENPYAIFGSYLSIAIFGSFVATIWKYQSHGGVWIIICFGMVLIYVVMYPMLVNIDKEDFSDNERFWWLMIPILLYLPLSVIFSLIGAKIFMRSEIES